MTNSAYNSKTGVESFNLQYTINDNESNKKNFNIDFFIELVNSVTGKIITKEFCDEFLQASENKFPTSKYGFEKLNGELIAKQKVLNFFEVWTITYVLSSNYEGTLSFDGLTKQFKRLR